MHPMSPARHAGITVRSGSLPTYHAPTTFGTGAETTAENSPAVRQPTPMEQGGAAGEKWLWPAVAAVVLVAGGWELSKMVRISAPERNPERWGASRSRSVHRHNHDRRQKLESLVHQYRCRMVADDLIRCSSEGAAEDLVGRLNVEGYSAERFAHVMIGVR